MNTKTTQAPEKGSNQRPDHETIRVIVTYPAAVKPYKAEVAQTTTLGEVKEATLEAFGLEETSTKRFKLFHGGTEFANLNETIGQIAGKHQEVVFQLEEVIGQG